MPAASGAGDLGPLHEERAVRVLRDSRRIGWLGEAGPAGARLELGVRAKELRLAAGAPVHARTMLVEQVTAECAFGSLLAQHVVALRRQDPTPLFVGAFGKVVDRCLVHGRRMTAHDDILMTTGRSKPVRGAAVPRSRPRHP